MSSAISGSSSSPCSVPPQQALQQGGVWTKTICGSNQKLKHCQNVSDRLTTCRNTEISQRELITFEYLIGIQHIEAIIAIEIDMIVRRGLGIRQLEQLAVSQSLAKLEALTFSGMRGDLKWAKEPLTSDLVGGKNQVDRWVEAERDASIKVLQQKLPPDTELGPHKQVIESILMWNVLAFREDMMIARPNRHKL